jgi:WD40 repeat protein
MDKSQKKTGSPILLFLAAFGVIAAVMLIINRRNPVVAQLQMPLNNGISNLSTYENLLAAFSRDNRLYIWHWEDLSKNYLEFTVESDQSALITPDRTISMERIRPDCVIVSRLDDSKQQVKMPLPFEFDLGWLGVNRDGSKIFILLVEGNHQGGSPVKYELFEVFPNSGEVNKILAFDSSEKSEPTNIYVCEDGRLIVIAGVKNNVGWMAVLDAKAGRLVWQKEMPEFKKIFKAVFSKDGDVIYARGTDSTLLIIKAASGEITDRLLPVKENKNTFRVQAVQTVAVSEDGRLVAATIFSDIFVWDTLTKKKLCQFGSGHKVISSITFSRDSRYIATSDMRQGGKIRILKLPRIGK